MRWWPTQHTHAHTPHCSHTRRSTVARSNHQWKGSLPSWPHSTRIHCRTHRLQVSLYNRSSAPPTFDSSKSCSRRGLRARESTVDLASLRPCVLHPKAPTLCSRPEPPTLSNPDSCSRKGPARKGDHKPACLASLRPAPTMATAAAHVEMAFTTRSIVKHSFLMWKLSERRVVTGGGSLVKGRRGAPRRLPSTSSTWSTWERN